jgi:transposase
MQESVLPGPAIPVPALPRATLRPAASASAIPLIGVDVAKDTLVTAVHASPNKPQTIANTPAAIKAWLKTLPGPSAIAMESTGRYTLELATQAHACGHAVYVLNAMDVFHYGKALGQRGKTDRLDSILIAQYLAHHHARLRLWQPTPAALMQLRALLKSRAHLADTNARLKMAFKDVKPLNTQTKAISKKFEQTMAYIDGQVQRLIQADSVLARGQELLRSINGVGPQGAALLATLLARVGFASSDALIAFSGLDPRPQDSGKKQGLRRLSKRGDPMIRRQLWLCAMSAIRSATFKPAYEALRGRGLPTTAALVVIARKLLRIAFAVWKSGQPFDAARVGQKALMVVKTG